jgi:hypothetical protein
MFALFKSKGGIEAAALLQDAAFFVSRHIENSVNHWRKERSCRNAYKVSLLEPEQL